MKKNLYDTLASVCTTLGVLLLLASIMLVPTSAVLADDGGPSGEFIQASPTCKDCTGCRGVTKDAQTGCPSSLETCIPTGTNCEGVCDCTEYPNGAGKCWCRAS